MNLSHVAKHAVGDQMGHNVQKAMPAGSPPHQGQKSCGLSKKMFILRPLLGPTGAFYVGFVLLVIFRSWHTL